MIYFDKDKQAYGSEIPEYIATIDEKTWQPYAGTDKWDIVDGEFLDITNTEEYKAKQEAKEKERITQLNMTRGDFFEGLILSLGKDEDDILALIDVIELTEIEKKIYKSRVKNALDFYRGYPLIDIMCGHLGLNPEQMTQFFETRDYKYLIPIVEKEDTDNLNEEDIDL